MPDDPELTDADWIEELELTLESIADLAEQGLAAHRGADMKGYLEAILQLAELGDEEDDAEDRIIELGGGHV